MEQLCKDKAQSFMDAFETYKTCVAVFQYSDNAVASSFYNVIALLRNDGVNQNGPYKKALELGLNDALFFFFQDEYKHVVDRFKQGIRASILETIHMYLFNNDRNNAAFNSIDGYRVKKYVRSKEDAFEKWFAASMKTFEIYQTQGFDAIKRNELDVYFVLKRIACNAAHCWSLVFTNRKAAKAILLGETRDVDDKARARAKWILSELKHVHSNFQFDKRIISICSSDQSLHSSVSAVGGTLHHFTALIEGRMNEFQIDIGNFSELLGLRGDKKTSYENMAVPCANAIIEKGADIDLNEANDALLKQALTGKSNMGKTPLGASPSSKTKGKKKGKKKNKK